MQCGAANFCGSSSPPATALVAEPDMNEGEVIDSRFHYHTPCGAPPPVRAPTLLSLLYGPQTQEEMGVCTGVTPVGGNRGTQGDARPLNQRSVTCSKPRKSLRSVSAAAPGSVRDTTKPRRESHSKRFRAKVLESRDALSVSDQVLTLKHENAKCKAELLAKEERLRELEGALRTFRERKVPTPTKVAGGCEAGSHGSNASAELVRLASENGEVWKRLRQSHAQIAEWKRNARVSRLHELKMDLAVYKAEVARLAAGGRPEGYAKHSSNHPTESQLKELTDALQEKDNIIAELRARASESAAALQKSMDDVMHTKSSLDQAQQQNELLNREICLFRKTALALAQVREELAATQNELAATRERLRCFEDMMCTVGGPEEVRALVRERDELLIMLKEHNAREAGHRRDFLAKQREVEGAMERCLREAVQQERILARDREVQLRRLCLMWKERYEQLLREGSLERKSPVEDCCVDRVNENRSNQCGHSRAKVLVPFVDEAHRRRVLTKHIDDVLVVRRASPRSTGTSPSVTSSSSSVSDLSKLSTTETIERNSGLDNVRSQISTDGERASLMSRHETPLGSKSTENDSVSAVRKPTAAGEVGRGSAGSSVAPAGCGPLGGSNSGEIDTSISTRQSTVQLPMGLMAGGVDSSDDSNDVLSDLTLSAVDENATSSHMLNNQSHGNMNTERTSTAVDVLPVSREGDVVSTFIMSPSLPKPALIPPVPVSTAPAEAPTPSEDKLSDVKVAVPLPVASPAPVPVSTAPAEAPTPSEDKLSDVKVAVPLPVASPAPVPVSTAPAEAPTPSEDKLSDVNVAVPLPVASPAPVPVSTAPAEAPTPSEDKLSDVNVAVPLPVASPAPVPVSTAPAEAPTPSEDKLSDVNVAVPLPVASPAPVPVSTAPAEAPTPSEDKLSDVNVAVPLPVASPAPVPVSTAPAEAPTPSEDKLSDVKVAVPLPVASTPPVLSSS